MFRPWRFAARVPVAEHAHRFVVRQIEAADDSTAHTKRLQIAALPRHCRIDALEECSRTVGATGAWQRSTRRSHDSRMRLGTDERKIRRREDVAPAEVLDGNWN